MPKVFMTIAFALGPIAQVLVAQLIIEQLDDSSSAARRGAARQRSAIGFRRHS